MISPYCQSKDGTSHERTILAALREEGFAIGHLIGPLVLVGTRYMRGVLLQRITKASNSVAGFFQQRVAGGIADPESWAAAKSSPMHDGYTLGF